MIVASLLLQLPLVSGALRHEGAQQLVHGVAPVAFADGLAAVETVPEHHDAEPHEHSGSPGAGGKPMVPRTHTHGEKEKKHEWAYASPGEWKDHYSDCSGKSQSPVNLVTAEVAHSGEQLLKTSYSPLEEREIDNNGHNVQVNGKFGTLTLPDGEYKMAQLHFHFPSEHEVNGKLAAGEMHMVHQKVGASGTDNLAVIGILFEEQDGDDASLPFMKQLGFEKIGLPKEGEKKKIGGTLDLVQAFGDVLAGGFFHYEGSLTTPPCSETVHWFVMERRAAVTPAMAANFKAMFPNPSNNRPVQAMNTRALVKSMVEIPAGDAKEAPEKPKEHEETHEEHEPGDGKQTEAELDAAAKELRKYRQPEKGSGVFRSGAPAHAGAGLACLGLGAALLL